MKHEVKAGTASRMINESTNAIDNAIWTIRELHEKLELPENYQIGFQDGWVRALESSKESEEVCEWKYISSVLYDAYIKCRGKVMNIRSMRYYKYCPYCGRKIKVVE